METISIIVPVFNVESYLYECVDSLVRQTYNSLEIILVDDESTDNSPALCDEWAKKDSRIKVIHNQHGGLSVSRNSGVSACSGTYITFIDSDDIVDVHYVEKLLSALQNFPDCSIASCCINRYIDGKLSPFKQSWQFDGIRFIEPEDFATRVLTMESQHSACAKLFKREILLSNKFRPGILNEDIIFDLDIYPYIEANKIKTIELSDVLYFYRVRPGSICYQKNDTIVVAEAKNMELIMHETNGKKPDIFKFYRRKYLESCIYLINRSLMNPHSGIPKYSLSRSLWKYCDTLVKKDFQEVNFSKFIQYKYLLPIISLLYRLKLVFIE